MVAPTGTESTDVVLNPSKVSDLAMKKYIAIKPLHVIRAFYNIHLGGYYFFNESKINLQCPSHVSLSKLQERYVGLT